MTAWNARNGVPGTKVSVPHTTDREVQRPRLLDVLTRLVRPVGGRREVVVVSAPAGYGKTTLLAGAARILRSDGTAVAWVTCAKDDGASALWAALLVSLHRALDGSDQAAADALASPVPPRTETDRDFLSPFLAALDGVMSETMVVLDDVHLIKDGSTIDGPSHVVDRAPDRLHFVLGCRHPPPLGIGRWWVTGRLRAVGGAGQPQDSAPLGGRLRPRSGGPDPRRQPGPIGRPGLPRAVLPQQLSRHLHRHERVHPRATQR